MDAQAQNEAMWREVLTHGHKGRWAFLPSNPRCAICFQPFRGLGGTALRVFTGYGPSRKNPNMCNLCDEGMPQGGAEVDVAVLFVDVRGSTALGERLGPTAFADLLNRFYGVATRVLIDNGATIDKMVGDEVMAFYIPSSGPRYRRDAVQAAEGLVRAVGYGGSSEPWLPVGVGVHAGLAFAGKIGTEGVHDFTVLGDTVNTAARLQAEAAGGEIILSEVIYQDVTDRYPDLEQRTLTLRGREEPISVRVLRPVL